MKSIYLSSLYNMLWTRNPLLQIWVEGYRNIRALINLHRNMNRARTKLNHMQHQYQAVESYIELSGHYRRSRFDVIR